MNGERREFGHLYKRRKRDKSGTMRELPYWWIRYKVNGKCYEESCGSADRRVAEKLLARKQAELGIGAFIAPDVKRTTVVELAQMMRDDYRVNGRRSLRRAETSLTHLLTWFGATFDEAAGRWIGGARVITITADRVTAYIRERQDAGAAPATIRNELAALKRMFTLGLRAGKVAQRPHIPAIQVSNARQGFFEEGDFRALLAELPEFLRPAMEFAYLTGWRVPSEVLKLTWAQVDFRAKVVRLEVGTTKNGEGRVFPFATFPALQALLVAQRERTEALEREAGQVGTIRLVFHRDGGKPIDRFDKAWKSACKRAAFAGDGPVRELVRPALAHRLVDPETGKERWVYPIRHDFRRTAVRNLVRAGVPDTVARKLTGHKTRAVFDRYDIVDEADLAQGVSRLAALHGGHRGDTGPMVQGAKSEALPRVASGRAS